LHHKLATPAVATQYFLAQRFIRAGICRIRFDQAGIELMLANELAEAVAGCTLATVPVARLGWQFLRFLRGLEFFAERSNLFDGTYADAVGLRMARFTARVSATRISAPWTRNETLEGSASP
jgi:hypothetical protein